MSAYQLITSVTWAVFVALFVTTAAEAIRRPSRTHTDIALVFAAPTGVVLLALSASWGLLERSGLFNGMLAALQLALPYMTVRLTRDFATVPAWLVPLALLGLAALGAASIVLPPDTRAWVFPLQLTYFVSLQLYSALVFAAESRRARGITGRRLGTVAVGAALLGLAPLAVSLRPPNESTLTIYAIGNLAAGICYFLGFSPPGRLRRSWQEPELRAFLRSTGNLTHLADDRSVVRALERGIADALGAPFAGIGLWDEAESGLRFEPAGENAVLPAGATTVARRAFLDQAPHRTSGVTGQSGIIAAAPIHWATMAAPISAGPARFGVLTVYAPREALFSGDDLDVVELLAAQVAVVLESRALIADLARVRAREEAARLKEDFLSAAAHDLKTPLTTLLGQAQLLERRSARNPEARPDPRSLALIVQSAERLRDLVHDMLDAARAERGQLIGTRTLRDLVELARELAPRYSSDRHPCTVTAEGQVCCSMDPDRLVQLVGHLLDNAVKYSPQGGPVAVHVWREGGEGLLSVRDHGIGIAPADVPRLFERFHRGVNVDDRSFAGMGLSLAVCRAIAEQHGGRIWAESKLGEGSVFTVALPLAEEGAYDSGAQTAHLDR